MGKNQEKFLEILIMNNHNTETKMEFIKFSDKVGQIPSKKSSDDAGYDLRAAEDYTLNPNEIHIIKTDIGIALPIGTYGAVVSRSGLASKGIVVNNAPGIIDRNYRGNIGVILRNQTDSPFQIHAGDRIAQLIVCPYINVTWIERDSLESTDRGDNGFGSSGIK